ncbi:unnamed protein product [Cochlearia groenlandica]
MNDASEGSSGSSSSNCRRRVVGLPKKYWCGCKVVELMSKSENNPYRRYYRCEFGAAKKIRNDNHCFKWKDEAVTDEIESLDARIECVEKLMKEITNVSLDMENMVIEKVQMKIEKDILERVEDEMVQVKCEMKKMIILVLVACLCLVCLIKII